jgi:spore maturation protein CgeB
VAKGASIAPETLAKIKAETGATLINYATDDPFNSSVSTRELIESISLFDIYACTKLAIMDDVAKAGSPNVAYVRFGYKPEVHFPEAPANEEERGKFESDVVFIGGCDADRARLFNALVREIPSLKLALYGGHWNRWSSLRRYWHGFAIGRDFRLALYGTKIAINLVRRANRDDHVMRTFEIPACGSFMLAERTATHEQLFREGHEAVLFSSVHEAVEQIKFFLPRASQRSQIARAGMRRILDGQYSYSDRLAELVRTAAALRFDNPGGRTKAVS